MTDRRWMQVAVARAEGALGTTAPNPAVGAAIVRDGQLLATGFTHPVGGPHAEVVALRRARELGHEVRGATMYVTLEPCCHVGRTPPCTTALLEAGVGRVVAGVVDPFGPMQGKGLEVLRRGGVEVTLGVEAEACEALVRGFSRAVRHGLPEVTAKVAASLDGSLATATGESQWITGEAARADGHHLRSTHDALLVGVGTVLADDPRLTCRSQEGRDPVPVVLDSTLRVSPDAAVFKGTRRPWIFCAEDAPERSLPGEVRRVPRGPGGLSLEAVLRTLAAEGLHRVLVEGGGQVHRSLLDARLVDTLHLYLGGVFLPGGQRWLGGPPLERLGDALRVGPPAALALGSDVRLTYSLPHRLQSPP